ncbi:MAG TPA: hypothetical protein VGI71_06325 [Scandinavium sp.]
MKTFNKENMSSHAKLIDMTILTDFSDFERWYCSLYDLSMFVDSEINALLNDEKPNNYPCTPLVSEDGLDLIYVGLDLIEHWFSILHRKNASL